MKGYSWVGSGIVIIWTRGKRMHFEILVEDISGKKVLDILIPKIIGTSNTFQIHSYKGIGRIPKNLRGKTDPVKRILLDRLPKLLNGYGKTYPKHSTSTYSAAVILVCDLDNKCLKEFRKELLTILSECNPQPETRFCIAIEEIEAWILGDIPAIEKHYSNVKKGVLDLYENDSICGTWEKLADAIFPKGAKGLTKLGWQAIGREKSKWAENIVPYMNINKNKSRSFCYFRDKLLNFK